jgi:hypothetical protein
VFLMCGKSGGCVTIPNVFCQLFSWSGASRTCHWVQLACISRDAMRFVLIGQRLPAVCSYSKDLDIPLSGLIRETRNKEEPPSPRRLGLSTDPEAAQGT